MDRDTLENLVNCDMSQRDLADYFGVARNSIRYWLNKYNISTNYKKRDALPDRKICPSCKKDKLNSEFYRIKSREFDLGSMCKSCVLDDRIIRRKNLKQDCVDYKGGECQYCGYNNCNRALDFHHIDPKTKKFAISQYRKADGYSLKAELDKCILVCSNCHREIHAGTIKL